MKNLVALILIVVGTSMTLTAQVDGRPYLSNELRNTVEVYEMPKADNVGPLINPPIFPMPQFIKAFIDPVLYNFADFMLPVKYEYWPYDPNSARKNISAKMPNKKER